MIRTATVLVAVVAAVLSASALATHLPNHCVMTESKTNATQTIRVVDLTTVPGQGKYYFIDKGVERTSSLDFYIYKENNTQSYPGNSTAAGLQRRDVERDDTCNGLYRGDDLVYKPNK